MKKNIFGLLEKIFWHGYQISILRFQLYTTSNIEQPKKLNQIKFQLILSNKHQNAGVEISVGLSVLHLPVRGNIVRKKDMFLKSLICFAFDFFRSWAKVVGSLMKINQQFCQNYFLRVQRNI